LGDEEFLRKRSDHDRTPIVASKILQSRCCSSRLAPNRVEKVGRQFTAWSVAVQPSERVASLILCDAATIIPPPEICRERTGIARSKGRARHCDYPEWAERATAELTIAGGPRVRILLPPPVSLMRTAVIGSGFGSSGVSPLTGDRGTTTFDGPNAVDSRSGEYERAQIEKSKGYVLRGYQSPL
jgi:hypothetical protein